jgi:glutamate racemase
VPDNRPIGVFDSGVGGLTVLRAIHQVLPSESTIYVGDLARCPYGTRPQADVRGFALQIADFLAREQIKMLVVACNTATAAAFDQLQARYDFPVVGVIAPAVDHAANVSMSRNVGVIATNGTVASGAYANEMARRQPAVTVHERSASWLVPIIERGRLARSEVAEGLATVLAELRDKGIDTLILGCTHFPIVRDIFERGVGPSIAVLDSAETTALEVQRLLGETHCAVAETPSHRLLATGEAAAFSERTQAMFRSSPLVEAIELEDISRQPQSAR